MVAEALLLPVDDPGMNLGLADMDTTHQEFIELLNRVAAANSAEFPAQFAQLVAHTEAHFEKEETLMSVSGFPSKGEHVADHQRILGQLAKFLERINAGKSPMMAKAYVREQLPDWFKTHLVTMDSALAAHLK